MNDKDIERLISLYLDGVENPEEMRQLDERVRQNPEVCRELIRLATQDASIGTVVEEQSFAREALSRPATSAVWRMRRFLGAAAAALVVACLGVLKWASSPRGASRELTGIVAETRGHVARWPEDARLKVGDVLRPGDAVHTGPDGYLKYAYRDGTVIGVRPNSKFELIHGTTLFAKAIRIVKGMLDATVRPQPADAHMTFSMPYGMVTVMGTILRLNTTSDQSEVKVHSGKVEVEKGGRRELIAAGELAVAGKEGLSKAKEPELVPPDGVIAYEDGKTLLDDSFEHGLAGWIQYTKQGEGNHALKVDAAGCPAICLIETLRDGQSKTVASLTGTEPEGTRVGISTKPIPTECRDFSLSYEYTYHGRPRLAMEGINIDINWEKNSPPFLNGTFTQKARPAGEWNQVRWECLWKTDPQGNPVLDSHLFFNGEFIARRTEHGYTGKILGLVLEVMEGQFLFDKVMIRELNRR